MTPTAKMRLYRRCIGAFTLLGMSLLCIIAIPAVLFNLHFIYDWCKSEMSRLSYLYAEAAAPEPK